MSVFCLLCKRGATWEIDGRPFCEAHKEIVIERFGVDAFYVSRLATEEDELPV